jgi:hypothetical protein
MSSFRRFARRWYSPRVKDRHRPTNKLLSAGRRTPMTVPIQPPDPPIQTPEPPTPNEQWTAARSLIEHYQTVINQRFTWISALEGLVFTGFAITVNGAANAKTEEMSKLLWVGVIVISIVGGTLPWLFFPALVRYGERLQEVRRYWEQLGHSGFPPLRQEPVATGLFRLETLPILASIAWTGALVFGAIALCLHAVPVPIPAQ